MKTVYVAMPEENFQDILTTLEMDSESPAFCEDERRDLIAALNSMRFADDWKSLARAQGWYPVIVAHKEELEDFAKRPLESHELEHAATKIGDLLMEYFWDVVKAWVDSLP